MVEPKNSKTNITTLTTTQVATGPCLLERIVVNCSSTYTVGIIDGTSGSTVNVGTIYKNPTGTDFTFNCQMAAGIRIITTQTAATGVTIPDITVVWR